MTDGPDIARLLGVLDDHRVAYVVAGSVAAMAHGVRDVEPADLDVVPDTARDNLRRLAEALQALDAVPGQDYGEWRIDAAGEREWVQDGRPRPLLPLDPAVPATFDHQFRTAHGQLDLVPDAAGSYEALFGRAVRLPLAGGERAVASVPDLLAGMTRPRRDKDGSRVRQLRLLATRAPSSGVGFVGFRTDRFEEMVALFRDRIGLGVVREAPGATWFGLGTDAELHVYADTDPDHAFFTTGPVVGLRVHDVEATRAALAADGLELLTEIERAGGTAWCHFRAPDGTVMEIIGPAAVLRRRVMDG